MKILVWAVLFLVLTVAGSVLVVAGIIGAPIGAAIEGAFGLAAAATAIWGIALFAAPREAPTFVAGVPRSTACAGVPSQ